MKEWTFIDKGKWPERGPWDSEPDKAQWQDEATGLVCLAVRARSHWCGYVGVPENHPAFQKSYDDVDVDVHGGLTFADFCQAGPTEGMIETGSAEARICHTPESGQPDRVWWLGFDCAHSGDKRPATIQAILDIEGKYPYIHDNEHYRTLDYVRAECRLLAEQLSRMAAA